MTPHINAKKEDIAKTVIMPGDPLRAQLIAENYLDNYEIVSSVRGMNTYTGTYKGKKITVMPSGMGIPSMGIYSYELFKFYEVDKVIKVGTCGSYTKDLQLGDVVLVNASYSESTYAEVQDNSKEHLIYADQELNKIIKETAKTLSRDVTLANIHCSDVFYEEDESYKEKLIERYNCLACEMESFSLLHNAKKFKKQATQILTVTDNLVTNERASSEERQNKVNNMLEIALESVLKL